ncbi:MAG: PPA1309 family protein [Nocardioidaceae bacterium]
MSDDMTHEMGHESLEMGHGSPEPGHDVPAVAPATSERALGLRIAVVEVERHASESGWDQPARLFALAPTADLAIAEPELAAELGISTAAEVLFTPVEQELDERAGSLEDLLGRISWPVTVDGAMVVVERVVLPPEVEEEVPDDPSAAAEFAAGHDAREEVRIAAGVLRSGEAHVVLRMRSHDSDDALLHGPDLLPGLVAAVRETLEH